MKTKQEEFQNISSLKVGDEIMVHAYKWNGWLYRSWNNPKVVDIDSEKVVLDSTNSLVITSEENSVRNFPSWNNKMTFWFFFKDEWFNLIATVEKDGLRFYINVASPFIYEEKAIKYYDFDLDFKISADDKWKEVDLNEFMINAKKYNYPEELLKKIYKTESIIKKYIEQGHFKNIVTFELLTKLHISSPEKITKLKQTRKKNSIEINEKNFNKKTK